MAKKDKDILWQIGHIHDLHAKAWVMADTFELATVEAAKVWEVPWREVAAYCMVVQKKEVTRNICCKCGRRFFGAPPLCDACIAEQRYEEQDLRRRLKEAYRTGKLG